MASSSTVLSAVSPAAGIPPVIAIRGAQTHNLKAVDLDLPRGEFIVFCGVSGSGKTSMAIDTLHAAGQQRYMESFSTYTRQFLEQLDKPPVERIDGLPPTIAVTRPRGTRSNRTTVATATELAHHLWLLFARAGTSHCTSCDQPLISYTPESVTAELTTLAEGTRLLVAFPAPMPTRPHRPAWCDTWREAGFVRVVTGERLLSLDEPDLQKLRADDAALVVVDRLAAGRAEPSRFQEAIETAVDSGTGEAVVLIHTGDDESADVTIDGHPWQRKTYRLDLHCAACNQSAMPPEPRLLDFNSPLGACPECEGFGSVSKIDPTRVVPDPSKSLRDGAIAPWNTPAYAHELEELLDLADDYDLPVDVPFSKLTDQQRELVWRGVPKRKFGGLDGFFRWLEKRKYKMHLRVFLSRWRSYYQCPACEGKRLRPEALAVRLGGRHLADLYAMQVHEAIAWLEQLSLDNSQREIAQPLLAEILPRLGYLQQVGVDYLSLGRPLSTLSTGEAQRVAMTATLGSTLVDMLYVLDEPTSGLHRTDAVQLLDALRQLRDRGNTVLVVDHEETLITGCDHVVEFGPEAGTAGGEVIFQGTPAELTTTAESPTGEWITGRRLLGSADKRRSPRGGWLQLTGARGHNLQDVTVKVPFGLFVAVTGVSGAGKSSLIQKTLYPALASELHQGDAPVSTPPLPFDQLHGAERVQDVVLIDQSPVARSSRSNPVTYVKAFDPIRTLFAEQPEAQALGLTPGAFSFNVKGGRCERCEGTGQIEVDMQFLADIYMTCDECGGQRYQPHVLRVHYRGVSIAEVLDMTVLDAFRFFRGHPKLQEKLKCLLDVGLQYVRLGQPANTLSGGEAQRLKLAGYLSAKRRGKTLFLLDEPSTGLHWSDLVQLVDCFDALIAVGHSVLVIEHNVPLLQAADYLIDLGPGAGERGGTIVVTGTPEEVAACGKSATGQVLAASLPRPT